MKSTIRVQLNGTRAGMFKFFKMYSCIIVLRNNKSNVLQVNLNLINVKKMVEHVLISVKHGNSSWRRSFFICSGKPFVRIES